MFGRDLAFITDSEDFKEMGNIFSTRPSFYGLNETIALPTIGGLIFQYGQKLGISHDVSYNDGSDAAYGISVK